jgi:hypothetical protein
MRSVLSGAAVPAGHGFVFAQDRRMFCLALASSTKKLSLWSNIFCACPDQENAALAAQKVDSWSGERFGPPFCTLGGCRQRLRL